VTERNPLASIAVDFVGSFPEPAHPLDPPLPEFALVGRSNVGKSSLLNALVGRRALARVSGTPGKTQLLNIYRLPALYLIDLPGYGFARAGQAVRLEYRRLLEEVLRVRTSLTGVVWLLDIRHPPSRDDGDFQDMLTASGRPVLPVLTKGDKLSRAQQQVATAARSRELGIGVDDIQVVSARTGSGIGELAEALLAAAREAA
jgi:GTP-binding protein